MGLFNRALLAIYTFGVSLFLLVGLSAILGWTIPLEFLTGQMVDKNARLFYVLIVAVFLVAGIGLLWFAVRGNNVKKSVASLQSVVSENEQGQVRIALKAIENLVEKEVSKVAGIKEVRPNIIYENEEIIINVSLKVSPDVRIPELSANIQRMIQEKVLEVTGIQVESVWVSVDDITVVKARVE